jgi:hypothetical protein
MGGEIETVSRSGGGVFIKQKTPISQYIGVFCGELLSLTSPHIS